MPADDGAAAARGGDVQVGAIGREGAREAEDFQLAVAPWLQPGDARATARLMASSSSSRLRIGPAAREKATRKKSKILLVFRVSKSAPRNSLSIPTAPHRGTQTRRVFPPFREAAEGASEIFQFRGNPPSGAAVLIGHQQQAADDRQVLEQLNPLHLVRHIPVEDQRRGDQKQQQQHHTQPCPPAADHQG